MSRYETTMTPKEKTLHSGESFLHHEVRSTQLFINASRLSLLMRNALPTFLAFRLLSSIAARISASVTFINCAASAGVIMSGIFAPPAAPPPGAALAAHDGQLLPPHLAAIPVRRCAALACPAALATSAATLGGLLRADLQPLYLRAFLPRKPPG